MIGLEKSSLIQQILLPFKSFEGKSWWKAFGICQEKGYNIPSDNTGL